MASSASSPEPRADSASCSNESAAVGKTGAQGKSYAPNIPSTPLEFQVFCTCLFFFHDGTRSHVPVGDLCLGKVRWVNRR